MAKFVQLVTFETSSGKFNAEKDTKSINIVLEELQRNKATIISVTLSVGGGMTNTAAVYVILYEANTPINI